MNYLQDNNFLAIKGLAGMHENYTVLWGMEPNALNTQVSEGAFTYNGEIIPFTASPMGAMIAIDEVIENGNFNTNPNNNTSLESLPAYSAKSAKIGNAGSIGTFNYSQLKRLPKIKIYQLPDFDFTQSGGYVKDISASVDINIVKRAFDWDLVWIDDFTVSQTKVIRNMKQHNGSTLGDIGLIIDAKLLYTPTAVQIQLNISSAPIIAPKLILHYL